MDAQQLPLYLQKHIWLMSRWRGIPEAFLFVIQSPLTTTIHWLPSYVRGISTVQGISDKRESERDVMHNNNKNNNRKRDVQKLITVGE